MKPVTTMAFNRKETQHWRLSVSVPVATIAAFASTVFSNDDVVTELPSSVNLIAVSSHGEESAPPPSSVIPRRNRSAVQHGFSGSLGQWERFPAVSNLSRHCGSRSFTFHGLTGSDATVRIKGYN